MIVVDASVAAKLFRDEDGTEAAHRLIAEHAGEIAVPDIFAIEVAGVIVRDANSDKAMAALQRDKLTALAALLDSPTLRLVRAGPEEVVAAAGMAMALGHPLKDCIYLALAIGLGCPLVTADARFAGRARSMYEGVGVLGEALP